MGGLTPKLPFGYATAPPTYFPSSFSSLSSYSFCRRLPCFKKFSHRRCCRHPHHHNHPMNHRRRCCVFCCCCYPPQSSPTAHDRNTSFCMSTYALPSTTSYDHMVSVGPTAGNGPAGVNLSDSLFLRNRARSTTDSIRSRSQRR